MRYFVIRAEKLSKQYGRRRALHNLTLEVEPGEIYGVLGPKGAGKTTLLGILMGAIHPTSGNALILGRDCQRQTAENRRLIGYLPEKFNLNGGQMGSQWIHSQVRMHSGTDLHYAHSLADLFTLDLEKNTREYSVSERKKLGLIQAMMHHPEVLILDEPTTGLDRSAQTIFYRLIHELRAESRTIIISSDSLTEMERVCDRVAVLNEGELVAVERGVQLRARALRVIEMRFASAVSSEIFTGMTNLNDLVLEDNRVRCTVQGDPDALIKLASKYRLMDIISQQPSLEEVYRKLYGIGALAG